MSFLYKPASKGKKIVATICGVVLSLFLIGVGVGSFIAYDMLKDAPILDLNDFIGQESSVLYDANGNEISELGAYLRKNVSYDEMSENLVDAFLSIEDSRFFRHPGFDLPRFLSAALANLSSGDFSQGGSTFTMQLIKNTYFTLDDILGGKVAPKSIPRKVQEIWLALNLEQHLDKQTIFQLYVNRINFGGNIRGVEKAAQYYFGKSCNNLTISEAAYLAGMINLPNVYNAYTNLEAATQRRNETLAMMKYHGYISEQEYQLALSVKLEDCLVGENYSKPNSDGRYQSYIDAVIDEAIVLTGKDPTIYAMEIYTNMNPTVQNALEDIMDGTNKDVWWPDDKMQFAFISMDNHTGEIVGIAGGRNYNAGARLLNRATAQFKNPGSAVKPFLSYALAFDRLGWSTAHIVTDKPIPLDPNNPNSHVFSNFDNQYRGDVTLEQAVGQSLNLPAISTLQEVIDKIGQDAVIKYLRNLGFEHFDEDYFNIQFAIGGYGFDTSVKEMAAAHAAMINLGEYNKPHTINKIIINGEEISGVSEPVRVVDKGAAYFVDNLMQYAVEGPYYNYMQILKRDYPVYAKTGTTDYGDSAVSLGIPKGAAKDKWMISSTNQYTNAIWVGYDKATDGYYKQWISQHNIPGNISSIMLDVVESISTQPIEAIEKPVEEIETIQFVKGSWPYAYPEDWMDQSWIVEGEVLKKFNTELSSIYDSINSSIGDLTSMSASFNADGSMTVHWGISGLCSGGYADYSYNGISAGGACALDTSTILGRYSFYGTIYLNDGYVMDISSTSGSTIVWPSFTSGGTVKVCGGWSNSDAYVCSVVGTIEQPTACTWVDEWGNVLPC